MRLRALQLFFLFTMLAMVAGCGMTQRGMKEKNTYFSTQYPGVIIKFGDNFEYHEGDRGEYKHQFIDNENHRLAFVHVFLHPPNETQIDYYHNPERWIYSSPPGSLELNRFVTYMIGEKWYVQDYVYHPSTASCALMRDLSAFADNHDVFKVRYSWEIPPHHCEQWKSVTSLSAAQQEHLKKFQQAFNEEVQITPYIDKTGNDRTSTQESDSASTIKSIATIQYPPKPIVSTYPTDTHVRKKVAIFPWILDGDSSMLTGYLNETLKNCINDSDGLELYKSYYKIKKIPRLNVPGYREFYTNRKPNLDLIMKTGLEEGCQIAVLGKMNLRCRIADTFSVREIVMTLMDVETGEIDVVKESSSNLDARDVIDDAVAKLFKKYTTKLIEP